MSETRTRRVRSLTPTQKIGSRVSDRYWPVRQVVGKHADGSFRTIESFVDMRSGGDGGEKSVAIDADLGWSGAPPDLPSGDPGKQACYAPASECYRRNYANIRWDQ